jgi:predicted dehydrogenase
MTTVGLIGCGGIAQDVVAALRANSGNGVTIVAALARPGRGNDARAKLDGIDIVETLGELLARASRRWPSTATRSCAAEPICW